MNELNDMMEPDHVIRVDVDGNAHSSYDGNVWAPELHALSDVDGQHTANTDPDLIAQAKAQGWELETGWTGQDSYSGPCMHSSEYVGGRIAEYILETPGLWCAVTICEDDDEPSSWALAHREIDT